MQETPVTVSREGAGAGPSEGLPQGQAHPCVSGGEWRGRRGWEILGVELFMND